MERLILTFLFGVALGWAAFYYVTIGPAEDAYTRCIRDGTPADNCARNYLLPKEGK